MNEVEGIGDEKRRDISVPLGYALLAVIIAVVLLFVAYQLLVWGIFQHLYSAKLGIDWFSTVFYDGYAFITPLVFAFAVINPFPRRSDLFGLFKSLTTRPAEYGSEEAAGTSESEGAASRNVWLVWQAVKWLVAYWLAYSVQGFLFYPNVTEALELDLHGFGSWSLIPRLISLPLSPASGTGLVDLIPTMQAQYYLVVSAIGTVLLVIAIRFFLKFVRDLLVRKSNRWILDILSFGLIVAFSVWMGAPFWLMNAYTPYLYGLLISIMFGLGYGILYFKLSGKGLVPITSRRRALTRVVAVLVVILLIFSMANVIYISFNWNNNWLQYAWTPQVQKQIYVTRWAAGLSNVNMSYVSDIPTGNISQMLGLVRQWDNNASLVRSQAQIGVNYLAIPNSEIVYLNSQQYWIQPTTIIYPPGHTDWISEHLIYTHADRVIVLNAHSGDYVSMSKALGMQPNAAIDNPLIYYGESGGFTNNVYVNVKNEPNQVGNAQYTWAPDYTLSGADRSLWFFVTGPSTWGFAFSPPQDNIEMLMNRNVFNRVSSTLISGLVVDPQTFLVTNGSELFYAVMVYIDYPMLTGFAQSDYLRNFAVVLVNVNDGSMHPYLVDNSSSFISQFFKEYYPSWNQPPPKWLVPQLRYPEQLLGTQTAPGQLDADFLYHVNTPATWQSGSDFYERPSNTPIYYVLINKGNQLYYVGVQLAEFMVSPGHNLGGIYTVYGGSKLGQMHLYRVNPLSNSTEKIFGPKAALQALETNPQIKEQITLLTNPTLGNVLPYLINGQLYYFIPAYVNTGSSGAVITKLAFMTVVDASNGVSAWGSSSAAAFNSLMRSENSSSTVITTGPAPVLTLDGVVHEFANLGYNITTPAFVNVNIGYRVGTISLSSTTVSSMNSTVSTFVGQYAVQNQAHTIYEWKSGNSTNFGVITARSGVSVAYYLEVTN